MSTRPDAMDHELAMLYQLRLRLGDSLHSATIWEHDGTSPKNWRNPRDMQQPGLRKAIEIVDEQIKLRTRP